VVRHLPAGVIIAEAPSGRLVLYNERAKRIWKHSTRPANLDEAYRLYQGFQPDGRPYEPKDWPLGRAIRNGEAVIDERIGFIRGDGSTGMMSSSAAPIRDAEGRVVAGVVVFHDITLQTRGEAERTHLLAQEQAARARAQSAEARFAFLGEIARSITSSLDLEAVLQRIVDGARELCGSDLAAIFLRDGASDVMVPRYRAGGTLTGSYEGLRIEPGRGFGGRVLIDHRPLRTADYRTESGDVVSLMVVPIVIQESAEGLLYVSHRRQPFSDEDESICGRLAAHAAIAIQNAQLFAREQAARAEAEAANQAKDRFLAVLSHELRTPLNAMMGWVKILRHHPVDEGQRRHALEVIERNTGMQAQLINDLLDVSRIIAGKLQLERYPVDLLPIIREAVEALRGAAEAQGVTLTSELDAQAGNVMGDPIRLHQIVANLVSNAVKFTPPRGHVEVRLARRGATVRLTVRDTGEGIAAEDLAHIFEPFRQADSSSSRRHQGLGLGLAIARQLVERQGGSIAAESEGKGGGATFTVEFPTVGPLTAVQAVLAKPALEFPAKRVRLDGVRVLVVDDQRDSRELVGVALQSAGADVVLAGSTAEALELLEVRPIEVLVSDLAMTIRAVALTAYADAGARERALGSGFEAYATKPIHPETLVEMIAKLSIP
jgi:signal transduction histidine kinase/CheY-like chemotaxis protein